jgi:hypothetical protein
MLKPTVTYYIVFARVLHFRSLDPLGQEQQVEPGRWLPTNNLRRVTSQKTEGLYFALGYSIAVYRTFADNLVVSTNLIN